MNVGMSKVAPALSGKDALKVLIAAGILTANGKLSRGYK